MSSRARLTCCNCGYEFYIYSYPNVNWDGFCCPACFEEIDESLRDDIVEAMLIVKDINYHFRKQHDEYKEPRFILSIDGIDQQHLIKHQRVNRKP